MIPAGRTFYKMSGSGNDFVVIDARQEPANGLDRPETVRAVCARGTGVGADGIVFLEPSRTAALRIRYLNSDGSLAALCGNATLCSARLAVELGGADRAGFSIETDAGILPARFAEGYPEIDLEPVSEVVDDDRRVRLERAERRAGFVLAGVPHVVIQVDDVDAVDVVGRGGPIRRDASFRQGANVNFVSPHRDGRWRMRTYERGVEAETLACGTGAVAAAILLNAWGEAGPAVSIETRSGQMLRVRLVRSGSGWRPSLAGGARIVYRGTLAEL
ncbi:MAG: diaminopimelate epimerase [Gemmatimonadaceae bacterium]